jgi:ubiquinone/menaquinone biosynthesis C-methylase UbiE
LVDHNRDVYERYVHEYEEYRLYPPEREFLWRLKDKWSTARMLDIGVGTGRTTSIFSMLVAEYVGIDYSEAMLEQCRRVLPERNGVSYVLRDARDLSCFGDKPFDVVLFSMNGLDSVDLQTRTSILREVLKVLAPGGFFFFSTHSIRAFSKYKPLPEFRFMSPVRSGYKLAKAVRSRLQGWTYQRHIDTEAVRKQKWAALKTGDHNYEIDIVHVDPAYQVAELKALGFGIEAVLDSDGRTVDADTSASEWLYFLCNRAPAN